MKRLKPFWNVPMRILSRNRSIRRGSNERFWRPGYAQNVKKGEVQEALSSAGVSLTLVPQSFPRKPA